MMLELRLSFNASQYDSDHAKLTDLLLPYKIEDAFHFTRLTDEEIHSIEEH